MVARNLIVPALTLAAILLVADPAVATTIVPMSDRDLATSSRAIVEGTVVSTEVIASPDHGAVYTYVTVDVESVLKGDVPPGQIVLRQLGGSTAEQAFIVHAAPELETGARFLLFLNTDEDGSLRVAHMKLGAYRIVRDESTGLDIVDREMGDGYLNPVSPDTITWRGPYDRFRRDIGDYLAEQRLRSGDEHSPIQPPIRISPPEYSGLHRGSGAAPAFTFLGAGFRWFEPDAGQPVRIKVNNRDAFTPSRGIDEVKAAFHAWSTVSGSTLRVVFDGTTSAGGLNADGVSTIAYGDPKRQIDDLVNCQGVVALASVIGNPGTKRTIGGIAFSKLVESDLILNNGIDCLTSVNPMLLEEILTHEFGHDLGLGHSSERFDEPDPRLNDATMYFVAHNDGRGATLRRDDSDAIRFLYEGPNGRLLCNTTALPDAIPGEPYSRSIDITGGTSPYSVTLLNGGLPAGLTMSASGMISGTAVSETTASFTIRVTDSDLVEVDRALSIRVGVTPAPFVENVKFTGSKLQITGLFLGEGASVAINGRTTPKSPKYKPAKSKIVVSGSAQNLGLRLDGTDVVVVTIGGLGSNAFVF